MIARSIGAKLFANGLKMQGHSRYRRCNKSFSCGVTNRKLAHKVWLRFSHGREMASRQRMYGEFIADFYRLVPVHFINNRRIHSPVAQMRATAAGVTTRLTFGISALMVA